MSNIAFHIVPVTPFEQNCVVLWEMQTNRATIIDPGGDLPLIIREVETNGLKLEAIWITHGHIDHAGGVAELRDMYNLPVYGPHIADKYLLDALPEKGAAYGIPARSFVPDRWLAENDTCALGNASFQVLHCPGHSPGSVVFYNKDEALAFAGDVIFRGSVGRTDLQGSSPRALMQSLDKLMTLPDDVQIVPGHGPRSTIGVERRSNPFVVSRLLD